MPFWSGEKLARRLPELIDPFNPDMIDCAAYELRMGGEVYVSPSVHEEAPDEKTMRTLEVDPCFVIPPGQFALLITEETVTVPDDAIAFISMKSKIKFNGLVNVSGFHVDPGYRGKILFSVFNAGPNPVHVKRGNRLLLIWYANLEGAPPNLEAAPPKTKYKKEGRAGHESIGFEYVNMISGSVLSLTSLDAEQEKVKSEWQKYRADIEKYQSRMVVLERAIVGLILVFFAVLISQAFRA